MNVNDYHGRRYEQPPCWALVADVYANELGYPIPGYQADRGIRSIARAFRVALHDGPQGLKQLDAPADHCIVVLGITRAMGPHHCGIYWRGSVLHALPEGNLYQDMASIKDRYQLIEFWGRA